VKYLLPEYPADLGFFPVGNILGNGGNTDNVTIFILNGRECHTDLNTRPIFPQPDRLIIFNGLSGPDPPEKKGKLAA
jgi:hypothetical protein